MKLCVQCHKEMTGWVSVPLHWVVSNGQIILRLYHCLHPDCPNYKLYQVGEDEEGK